MGAVVVEENTERWRRQRRVSVEITNSHRIHTLPSFAWLTWLWSRMDMEERQVERREVRGEDGGMGKG